MSWSEQLRQIAEDFEHADVQSFTFTCIDNVVKCEVRVKNTDGAIVTWRLSNRGEGGEWEDRWTLVLPIVYGG